MTSAQLLGVVFFTPMIIVTFSLLGFHYYTQWKEHKESKGPMATFNKR